MRLTESGEETPACYVDTGASAPGSVDAVSSDTGSVNFYPPAQFDRINSSV